MANKSYKQDFEGVMLMRKTFPKKVKGEALVNTSMSRALIEKMANKLFFTHRALFEKAGIAKEDVESLFTCYAYVLFSKISESQARVLTKFLQQRGTKLVGMYKTLTEKILETPIDLDDSVSLEELMFDNNTPEQIMIAKEQARNIFNSINGLIKGSQPYINAFYKKHSLDLRRNDIAPNTLGSLAHSLALKYAEKKYKTDTTVKLSEFKTLLISEMSKLLKSLRKKAVNE